MTLKEDVEAGYVNEAVGLAVEPVVIHAWDGADLQPVLALAGGIFTHILVDA